MNPCDLASSSRTTWSWHRATESTPQCSLKHGARSSSCSSQSVFAAARTSYNEA